MRRYQWTMLCLWLVALLASCGKEPYHYPSVKEEFFSASAKADSLPAYIITDDGERREVVEWGDNLSRLKPDTLYRLMGYYEDLASDKVKVYSFVKAISPNPVPAQQYADSVSTAPIILHSAWLGGQYVNIVLSVKEGGKKRHHIVFLEEDVTPADASGVVHATFSIHHNDGGDDEVYQTRAYASLPLSPYLQPSVSQLDITLSCLAYDGRVLDYSFVYKP